MRIGDNEMLNMSKRFNSISVHSALCWLCASLVFTVACTSKASQPAASGSSSAAKRYALKGKVISVDKSAGTANIDNEPIAGFMDAMIMSYPFRPATALDQLQPGDSITADVVLEEPGKYWLENVKVVGHSTPVEPAGGKPTSSLHIPSPGDEVPDFKLVNQNGRRSPCINIAARLCCLRSSTHVVPSRISARVSATSSLRSTARFAPTLRATAKLIFSASASIPRMTRPKCCAPMDFHVPEVKIPRSSDIGSSPSSHKLSCRNSPIILL